MTQPLPITADSNQRKDRGAYFTPAPIAEFLTNWAIARRTNVRLLDPTCGEGVFLTSAARALQRLGTKDDLHDQLFGVDIHDASLHSVAKQLEAERVQARLIHSDFFSVPSPGEMDSSLGYMDAIVGNPPFVRYQQHAGDSRKRSVLAAIHQGVKLSGLASSWAAVLVHSGAFLKPDGRLGMVLPAELLTVGYAEPVRRWLRRRFGKVDLVLFERLQFQGALEDVILLLAQGTGGCDTFSLHYIRDGCDLQRIQPFGGVSVVPSDVGKWTDLLLSATQRQVFKRIATDHFCDLGTYGSTELGTVTGANNYFTLTEGTRLKYGLNEFDHVRPICPPGTRWLKGLSITKCDWNELRQHDQRVWILYPNLREDSPALLEYLEVGERLGVPEAYKCRIRSPWWRPPLVSPPDLFFTYMSHHYPKLVANEARLTFLNSMHGVRLRASAPRAAKAALPLLALNSVTMLGAEVYGRSYGGGILKMEPREATRLPVPGVEVLDTAWNAISREHQDLEHELRNGRWRTVWDRVDDVLLRQTLKLSDNDVCNLREATESLRSRRLTRGR